LVKEVEWILPLAYLPVQAKAVLRLKGKEVRLPLQVQPEEE
jgi:hypothetical protein